MQGAKTFFSTATDLDQLHSLLNHIGSGEVGWALFASTFGLVFVAELPDKTALAALVLSTSHHPLAVFLGSAAAFVVQSIVAVAFGSMFALLPERSVHIVAALLFFVFAVLMWRRKDEEDETEQEAHSAKRFMHSVLSSFLVIFVAEWGDLTQLATAALAAKYREPLTIFFAATLALWSVAGIGVFLGNRLKHLINVHLLQRIAALAMAGAGCYLLLGT